MAKSAKAAAVTAVAAPAESAAETLRLRVVDSAVDSCLGVVEFIKIHAADFRPLGWREVWERFAAAYPGRWAVQCFPPADQLVDGKSVYHLFVLAPGLEPQGLNIKAGA